MSSAPANSSGLHQYTFLIYEQLKLIDIEDEARVDSKTPSGRRRFSISTYAEKQGFGPPVAWNFYLAEYDDHVPKVLEQLGLQ